MKLAPLALLLALGCSGGNRPKVERVVNAVTGPREVSRPRHPGPDPAFVNIKWGPLGLAPGATGTVELDIVNRGEQPFGAFRVGVYGNLGSVVTGKKALFGTAEAAGPGRVLVSYTAPATPGYYALEIMLDDLRQVPGDDVRNNKSAPAQLIVK
jgi:hypothetical protein